MTSICLTCRQELTPQPGAPAPDTCPDDGQPLYPVLEEFTGDAERLVGRILDGRYRVEALLGSGGMGLVLRAEHVFLERTVAVKLLHPELLLMPEVKARFKREARAASAVSHDNVVDITDFGVTHSGIHYLVMEFLAGCDLHDFIERQSEIPVEQVARIGIEICHALSALHEAGFVHRDLKPENVQLLPTLPEEPPAIKLLDFGVAGLLTPDPGSADRLTGAGRTIGTPSYMSPEQALARPLDARTDLYALACVLWEALTGKVLFGGDSALEIMKKHLSEPPRAAASLRADVPGWLDAVLARALAKQPEDRYPDADTMALALEAGLALKAGLPLEYGVAEPGDPFADSTGLPLALRPTGEAHAATASWDRLPSGVGSALTIDDPIDPIDPPPPPQRPWLMPALLLVASLVIGALLFARYGGLDAAPALDPEPALTTSAAPEPAPEPAATLKSTPTPPVEQVEPVAPTADAAATSETGDLAGSEPSAVAESVVLSFRVEPDGAEVVRDGEVLGVTPLSLVVDRAAVQVRYEVRAAERQPLVLEVSHDSARTIAGALTLQPKPKKVRRTEPAPSRKTAPAAGARPVVSPGTELMRPATSPTKGTTP